MRSDGHKARSALAFASLRPVIRAAECPFRHTSPVPPVLRSADWMSNGVRLQSQGLSGFPRLEYLDADIDHMPALRKQPGMGSRRSRAACRLPVLCAAVHDTAGTADCCAIPSSDDANAANHSCPIAVGAAVGVHPRQEVVGHRGLARIFLSGSRPNLQWRGIQGPSAHARLANGF